ncbi:hypothetical protein O181_077653 [Austropuccinia psidii MF-1]|uniref:Uncharacterized protein n=1 Tax=Austropuccinia psidii MF-1 TaxID=1389203 RepID=A0A9Q3IDX3_9BASI|nr:hypothetical protein [Austropuccinia psidii MF-1]
MCRDMNPIKNKMDLPILWQWIAKLKSNIPILIDQDSRIGCTLHAQYTALMGPNDAAQRRRFGCFALISDLIAEVPKLPGSEHLPNLHEGGTTNIGGTIGCTKHQRVAAMSVAGRLTKQFLPERIQSTSYIRT